MSGNAYSYGSSPRARGTARWRRRRRRLRRFIPACAGNRRRRWTRPRSAAVHPRVRGEQTLLVNGQRQLDGSSPRARGTEPRGAHLDAQARFIPACAGNRCRARRASTGGSVHPRVRGEQHIDQALLHRFDGSSPRARGTGDGHPRRVASRRFIPACAGNRRQGREGRRCPAVHPRVRGEQPEQAALLGLLAGSSPRARGTDGEHVVRAIGNRFIPACAGNRR